MERAVEVRPEIMSLIADVFKFEGRIDLTTSRREVPKWDSLQHVALVAAIEERFGIVLSMDEMIEIKSIKDICNVLERHGV